MKVTRSIINEAATTARLKHFDIQSIEKTTDMSSGKSFLSVRAWVYDAEVDANLDRTFTVSCKTPNILALAKELNPDV